MKKLIVLFSCLLFSFTLFSVQDTTLDVVKVNENNLFFQTIGKGKNNLIFIFDDLIETKEQLENNVLSIKDKIETFSQTAEIFAVFLSYNEVDKYWLRSFPENYQQSFFYITQKVNCTTVTGSNKLTESVIDFFKQNHSSFNEQTIVFLVRNDIENIYTGNYSAPIQDCVSQFKKIGITNIYPEIQINGTLSLWLEKQYRLPVITIPFKIFESLSSDYFSSILKKNKIKDLLKNNDSERIFFQQLILQSLPKECDLDKIEKEDFFDLLKKSSFDSEMLLLPNKKYSLDKDYIPEDLESLDGKKLSPKTNIKIRKNTLEALIEMKKAAQLQNCNLQVISAFRSYNTQHNVFMHWVKEFGMTEAQRISARPGTSQHQLGTAIDFNLLDESFADYPEGIWLKNNAYKYGFILSFPRGMEYFTGYRYEPWHYRYVGKEAALLIKNYFNDNLELFLQWYWKLWQPL